jgi:hypothetical protein
MAGPRRSFDRGVEIDRLARCVDDGRACDSERIDIAARQRRSRDGRAEGPFPNFGARIRIDCVDDIVFGREEQDRRAGARRAPIKRLRLDMSCDPRAKILVEAQRTGSIPGQPRDHEIAAAIRMTMVGKHRSLLGIGVRRDACSERHA